MNFSTIIGLILLFFNYRKEQYDLNNACDQKDITPSDYAIIITNIENDKFILRDKFDIINYQDLETKLKSYI